MGLSFTIAAGPRQRIHSRVRVLWDSRLYFTVSDYRLPFLSPSTTRRATVEVLDPASDGFSFFIYIYSLRTDCLEDTASSSSSIVALVSVGVTT
jgi:hypothetical protein